MKPSENKQYLFDNPRNVRLVIRGLLIVCALLVGLDFVLHRHSTHPLEEVFAFYAIYGFVSCVLLVLLAKEMRKLLMRDEHYYDDDQDGDASASTERQEQVKQMEQMDRAHD